MIDENVQTLITRAVKNILERVGSKESIASLSERHAKKIHFIPRQYRVFGGMLQSMNIQFGNFIEELMTLLIDNNKRYSIVTQYSGKKNNVFMISGSVSAEIDQYIDNCQLSPDGYCNAAFPDLQRDIISNTSDDKHYIKHDIDLLFEDVVNGKYYYLEIKYNDDHDTGKFVDINRKFIKTYAYLVDALNIQTVDALTPILFFFNNKKMKGNPYIPEATNIRRGRAFFDEFLDGVEYNDLNNYMQNLSESDPVRGMFDDLYDKVVGRGSKTTQQNSAAERIVSILQ